MLKRILIMGGLFAVAFSSNAFAKNVKGVLVPVIGHAESLLIGNGIAEKSDVIFSQKLIAEKTARLETPFYLKRDKRFNPIFDVKPEDILYAVNFPNYEIAYCSVKTGYSQKPMTGKRWNSQICLIDTDKNGAFDLEYAGAVRKFDSTPLSLGMLWSDNLGIDALPYTTAGPNQNANVEARLELSKVSSKKLNFKVMVQWIEGDWVEHGKQSIKINKDVQFPLDVDIYGAKVKINSIDKTSINYEVISGFSETDALLLE